MKEQSKSSRSVTVTVKNATNNSFYRKKFELTRGSWTCLPPDVFLPGKTASFGARGSSLMTGTTGRVVYQSENSSEAIELFYDNPFLGEVQVIHSRPLDFRLDVDYRKQEHLRITVSIHPLTDSGEVESQAAILETDPISSSPSSSTGSALPLHKVANQQQQQQQQQPTAQPQKSSPRDVSLSTKGSRKRIPSPAQHLGSGEEDEDDALHVSALSRSPDSDSGKASRSKSRAAVPEGSSPKLRRQGTSDKLGSSSSRVSLDLVHNAARFVRF